LARRPMSRSTPNGVGTQRATKCVYFEK
jgi:hypothetical protein